MTEVDIAAPYRALPLLNRLLVKDRREPIDRRNELATPTSPLPTLSR